MPETKPMPCVSYIAFNRPAASGENASIIPQYAMHRSRILSRHPVKFASKPPSQRREAALRIYTINSSESVDAACWSEKCHCVRDLSYHRSFGRRYSMPIIVRQARHISMMHDAPCKIVVSSPIRRWRWRRYARSHRVVELRSLTRVSGRRTCRASAELVRLRCIS